MTLQELVDRSVEQSGITTPDVNALAENLVPRALKTVAMRAAGDPERRGLLRSSQSISFTNGAGTIADTVLLDYLCDSVLKDTTDFTKEYAYTPNWDDFVEAYDRRLGYYWNAGTQIVVVEPGVAYVAGSGITASRQLTTPTVPAVPATASTAVVVPDVLVAELIAELALMVRV